VIEADGHLNITDINGHSPADTSLVKIEISPTEYYLVSNRLHDRNMNGRFDFGDVEVDSLHSPENEDTLLGAEFDFFLTATTNPFHYEDIGGEQIKITDTGSGIMIWHIDETIIRNRLGLGRYPNDDPGISGVDLEEADGVQDLDRPGGSYAFGSWGDSYRDGWYSRFGPETIPASFANTGTRTGLAVETESAPGVVMGISIEFGEGLPRVTGEIGGTVMNLPPVAAQLDLDPEEELVQAADTGMIYIAWDSGEETWDGSFDLAIDISAAVWSGAPIAADLDDAQPLEILAGSRDGRIHAYRTDGSPFPIDNDHSPGSLDVKGEIVSMPMGLEADGSEGSEAVFLVSDGDTTWMYLVGHDQADQIAGQTDGFITGEGVLGMIITTGRVLAHPVLYVDESDPDTGGFFTVAAGPEGSLRFIHIVMMHDVPGMSITSWNVNLSCESDDLILPASGDIDGNGTDDIVLALPCGDLVYFDIARGYDASSLSFYRPSPPSLADIDDDGVLETIIRDRDGLYLLTGFGTPVTGWPLRLQDHIVMLEPDTTPAQPAAADIDGDGKLEMVFNVAGELRAYRYDGMLEDGWPVFGEGDHTITPAISRGAGSKMFIFDSGGSGGIAGPDETGTDFFPGVSTVSRIDPGIPWEEGAAWPAYRKDPLGTSRQTRTEGDDEDGPLVDGSSMICYPNPATGNSFRLRLNVSGRADVTVRLFNVEGTEVYSSVATHEWSGSGVPFEAEVPTGGLASGIYLCHVNVRSGNDDWSGLRKIAILK
jgi:hypothetical protein